MVKIPVNQCKKLLQKIMYKDTATIYRSARTKNSVTGAMEFSHQAVYEKIPCKLSQYKDIYATRNERTQEITLDFRLTCEPEIEILENDFVEVLHEGKIFKLVAGTSFNYPTHKEISMRRQKEAKQK